MSERPISVKADVPHPALPSANWADCYQLSIPGRGLTASDAARMVAGRFPFWIRSLMRMRDAFGGLAGLKPSTFHSPDQVEMIGIFPVVSRSDNEIVLGFDDRHLDFRIVINTIDAAGGGQVVRVTALVDRKILLGKIYIAVITPFHKLIVASMLAKLGKRLAAGHITGVAV